MKFLKLKYIVSYLIILLVGILAIVYFVGGLKVHALSDDDIAFSDADFINFNTIQYDEFGERIEDLVLVFDNNKLVAENDRYALVFDEETTIAKVIDKDSCTTPGDLSTATKVYETAQNTKNSRAANLQIEYAQKSNGKKAPTTLDSMLFSVQFENTLTGEKERHYKVKYIDNGVQILYEIGRFSANLDYFPAHFDIADFNKEVTTEEEAILLDQYNIRTMEGRFRGNTTFDYNLVLSDDKTYYTLDYTYTGYTYSLEAVNYIKENNLATVVESDEDGLAKGWWRLLDVDPNFIDSYGVHLNTDASPCTNNPFFSKQMYTRMGTYYVQQQPSETIDRKYWDRKASSSSVQTALYNMLYLESEQTEYNLLQELYLPVYDLEGNPIIRGGFHAVGPDGDFLYDDDNKPIQQLYTLEQVALDNEIFNIQTSTSLERFQVVLQFVLTEDGLEATIVGDSLKDGDSGASDANYQHDYILTGIRVLPELTTADNLGSGMMVIPDGSGAFIRFNNNKAVLNYSAYSKSVYGDDYAFLKRSQPESVQTLMFGMYGFINEATNQGLMVVAEKGAAQSTLFADTPRGTNLVNTIYYTALVRETENVQAGTGWNTSTFPKWAKNISRSDLIYRYVALEPAEQNYVGLANRYRTYLIDKYDLTTKDTTTDTVVDINFLGAFERYSLFLGIKYMTPDSLTTFDQAKTIIEELQAGGVNHFEVGYNAWTKKELEYEATRNLKVSPVLGGKKGMEAFSQFLDDNSIRFYPELFVATAKGYDYAFGNVKYSAKGVGNDLAVHYPYNLATLMPDKTLAPTYYIAPSFYQNIASNLLASYQKLGIGGAYLSDLGNLKVGDYERDEEIYAGTGTLYQREALGLFQSELDYLKLSAPFDYALPYVQTATNIPMTASSYGIFDGTIPFYQLVVSGLFDYTTDLVNGTSDKSVNWYYTKALETGSNIHFQLSYTNPNILLETDYTQYFKSYYANWKSIILDLNQKINASNIHQGRLINHEIIAKDISKVTYSNNVVLVINSGNTAYNYGGTTVEPYDYITIGG